MLKNHKPNSLKLSVLAIAITALPLSADAAGLGKLTVLSPLGKPLRAELDVSASGDELSSLTARIAPIDAFRQANIDYVSTLAGLHFTLDKRPGGQAFFRITSDRGVNDPFLDFLVELNWASGRLVREYTFLLDPAELKPSETVAVAATMVPETKGETPAKAAETRPEPMAEPRPVQSARAGAMESGENQAAGGATRNVKRGDTLAKIANEFRPEGVSLDQMLVALFRSNPSAFDGSNMNRLRAGKILNIPAVSEASAVSAGEAHRTVVAQSADFAGYRRQLAAAAASAAPVTAEAPTQEAKGRITPKIEEKLAPAPGKDQLQVSRTDLAKAGAAAAANKQLEEDLVAREKALKEANSRIADLEKNLNDLKKLAELKSKGGAEIQKQAEQKPALPAEPAAKPPAAAVVPAPTAPAAPAMPAVTAGQPAVPPPAPPKPVARPPVPPPPPPPEPSFLEANLPYLAVGGGILALLAAFFGFKTFRRKREDDWGPASTMSSKSLAESSVFSVSGGKSVDTGGPVEPSDHAAVEAENVDPLQEAEVYMAYGRDAQAEEILLDALGKTPNRLEIHGKLLEIYAARRSIPQFVTLAEDVKRQTHGSGPEWEHALSLGRVLDPANPLFGAEPESTPAAPAAEPAAAPEVAAAVAQPVMDEVPESLDFDLDLAAPAASPAPAAVAQQEVGEVPSEVASEAASPSTLDFDLGLDHAAEAPAEAHAAAAAEAAPDSNALDIDFDLPEMGAAPAPAAPEAVASAAPAGNELDFDLGEPAAPAAVAEVPVANAEPAGNAMDFDLGQPMAPVDDAAAAANKPLDFDFDLGEPPVIPAAPPPDVPLDLSAISLDLDQPLPAAEDAENAEVATKLELAQAYQEMGDKDGARELLQEVIKEGSLAQQETARNKLAALG